MTFELYALSVIDMSDAEPRWLSAGVNSGSIRRIVIAGLVIDHLLKRPYKSSYGMWESRLDVNKLTGKDTAMTDISLNEIESDIMEFLELV